MHGRSWSDVCCYCCMYVMMSLRGWFGMVVIDRQTDRQGDGQASDDNHGIGSWSSSMACPACEYLTLGTS